MNQYTREEFLANPQEGYFWMVNGRVKKVIKVSIIGYTSRWVYNNQCEVHYLGALYDGTNLFGPIEEPEILV